MTEQVEIITTPETYTIPNFQFEAFIARFAKANRKAKKFGCVAPSFAVISETVLKVRHPDATEASDKRVYHIPAKIVTVTGVAPQVGNHELLARIEYLSDSKSKLFHTVPGTATKVDERFRALDASVCEHCNARRTRRDTFVVRNVISGEQKQIGRNCLADYLGGVSPEQIAARAAYFNLFDDIGSTGENDGFRGYFVDKVDTESALRLTSAYISLYGWVPKSQSSEQFRPTASRVHDHFLRNTTNFTDEEKAEVRRVSILAKEAIHAEVAAKVIEWVKNDLVPVAKSDYELNLCTLVVGELTESRHMGLVCSAVSAYQRAMNRGVEYARKHAEAGKSEFIAAKGDKIKDLAVSVQFVKGFANKFGPVTLVKFADEKGNVLSWFATGDKTFTPGERLTISGSVKDLVEYQGAKETRLTRVKVSE